MKITVETIANDDAAIAELFELLENEVGYSGITTDDDFQRVVLMNSMMVGVRERIDTLKFLREHKIAEAA